MFFCPDFGKGRPSSVLPHFIQTHAKCALIHTTSEEARHSALTPAPSSLQTFSSCPHRFLSLSSVVQLSRLVQGPPPLDTTGLRYGPPAISSSHYTTPKCEMDKLTALLDRGEKEGEVLALWLSLAEREYTARAQLEAVEHQQETTTTVCGDRGAHPGGAAMRDINLESLRQELAKLQGQEATLRSLSRDLARRSGESEEKHRLMAATESRKQTEQYKLHREKVDAIQARLTAHTAQAEAVEAEKEALQVEIASVLALLQEQDDGGEEKKEGKEEEKNAEAGEDMFDDDGNVDVPPKDRERFSMAQSEYRTKLLLLGAEDKELQEELSQCQSRVGKVADEIAALHSEFKEIAAKIAEIDSKSTSLTNDTKDCERRLPSLSKSLSERQTSVQCVRDDLAAAQLKASRYDELSKGLIKALTAVETEVKV